jgi:putative hemolysin
VTVLISGTIAPPARYSVRIAGKRSQVAAALRLRYQVFALEQGAVLHTSRPGFDVDDFDSLCDHLIMTDNTSGEVVGTCRLLPSDRIKPGEAGLSEVDFNLAGLGSVRDRAVDLGRVCIHPAHRGPLSAGLMRGGILRYLYLSGSKWLAGSIPVHMTGGGNNAALVWRGLKKQYLSPANLRVVPYWPWRAEDVPVADQRGLGRRPVLLRHALRLGAWVCGPPSYDPDFASIRLFMLLSLEHFPESWSQSF